MRPYLITAKLMRPSNMKRFPTPGLDLMLIFILTNSEMYAHSKSSEAACSSWFMTVNGASRTRIVWTRRNLRGRGEWRRQWQSTALVCALSATDHSQCSDHSLNTTVFLLHKILSKIFSVSGLVTRQRYTIHDTQLFQSLATNDHYTTQRPWPTPIQRTILLLHCGSF
jgi:hypothetical protein